MGGVVMEQGATRCEGCKFYLPLTEPFQYEKTGYPQGVTVYGFCAKDAAWRGSFYPVYLPDGGVCKSFQKGRKKE